MNLDSIKLHEFLQEYPEMGLRPSKSKDLIIKGPLHFSAKSEAGPPIEDRYNLEILVPFKFPMLLPTVKELEQKIPPTPDFHVNPDESLCLGSSLRLKKILKQQPSITGFVNLILVPYLYGVSLKLNNPKDKFFMGELDHGESGIIDDYKELFGLETKDQVIAALNILSLKKRIANKRPCPCECGLKLGQCKKRNILNQYRDLASRAWYKLHLETLGTNTAL